MSNLRVETIQHPNLLRTFEILETIQEHPVVLSDRLNHYCRELESLAKKFNCSSEKLVELAESNELPFDVVGDVLELSLLIKRHKTA